MVTTDEELEAAQHAQTIICTLSTSSTRDRNTVATLRKIKDVAVQAISIFQARPLSMTHEIKWCRLGTDLNPWPAYAREDR